MGRKRFSEAQIIAILKEGESGIKIVDLTRKHGISDATFYKWKTKYGGLSESDLRRLKVLEEENRKLKAIVADLTLDVKTLQEINKKNW
jgi:putative transposase